METLPKPSFRELGPVKRRRVDLDGSSLVATSFLEPEKRFPLVVRPLVDGLDLITWAEKNRAFLESNLYQYGAILFRDFDGSSTDYFERFIQTISGPSLNYTYRSTPRERVGGNIFTSTEYPPDMPIFLHNENSYSRNWAMKLFFLCVQ